MVGRYADDGPVFVEDDGPVGSQSKLYTALLEQSPPPIQRKGLVHPHPWQSGTQTSLVQHRPDAQLLQYECGPVSPGSVSSKPMVKDRGPPPRVPAGGSEGEGGAWHSTSSSAMSLS